VAACDQQTNRKLSRNNIMRATNVLLGQTLAPSTYWQGIKNDDSGPYANFLTTNAANKTQNLSFTNGYGSTEAHGSYK